MIAFVTTFWKIFLEYSSKNLQFKKKAYYFIKVCLKNLAKNIIFKKIQIHLQVFLLFKNKNYNFNERFYYFSFIGLISN